MEVSSDTNIAALTKANQELTRRLSNLEEMFEEYQGSLRSVAKVFNKASRQGKGSSSSRQPRGEVDGTDALVQWLPALVKRYPKFACMQVNGDQCDKPLHRELRELIRGYPKLEPGNKGKGYRLNVAHEDHFIECLVSVLKRDKWDAYKDLFEPPPTEEPDSEKDSDLDEDALRLRNVPFVTKQLPVGDVVVERDGQPLLILERKTRSDLHSSIVSGRHHEQRERLKSTGVKVCYLLESGLAEMNLHTLQQQAVL
ncbi:hypothetical protein HDU81_009386 [Chytriomyces hyalinus]|nr:hypothetical protein HDU81_009386 [Chytriomyces hyalinus]